MLARNYLIFVLATALAAMPVAASAEEGKSALSPTKLSLPKGPGSIEGIGQNAELNLVQGAATFKIPFTLPAGHAGFTPSLGLLYHSGSGNSVVGIGWTLGVPSIERMTSKGLPNYGASDLFASDNGDELVRVSDYPAVYRARAE